MPIPQKQELQALFMLVCEQHIPPVLGAKIVATTGGEMSDALRNIKTNVALAIGRLPGRKQACFYFEITGQTIPVAYVRENEIAEVEELWAKLLDGIPIKEDK
jgi:hypothetical protein